MTARRLGTTLVLLGCLAACRSGAPAVVDRVAVDVRVLPGGTAEVHEVLTARLADGQRRFERRVSLDQADAVMFQSATFDGQSVVPNASGPIALTVGDGRRLDVRWTLPAGSSESHVFGLTYRAAGVVAVLGQRGRLRLGVIPGARPYAIGSARLSFEVPESTYVFDGTGVAEAGWQVERLPHGIAATRDGIGPAEGATIIAEISADASGVIEPAWQINEERTVDLIPAFVSGGLFVLVIGAGILWIVRLQYPRRHPAGDREDERRQVRTGLRISGWVSVVAAVVFAGVTWLTLSQFGLWPMWVPGSMFLVGVVFVLVSRRYV